VDANSTVVFTIRDGRITELRRKSSKP